MSAEQHSLFQVGDQVKIIASDHPWSGEIGLISRPFSRAGLDWAVELQTVGIGGREAGVREDEIRHV